MRRLLLPLLFCLALPASASAIEPFSAPNSVWNRSIPDNPRHAANEGWIVNALVNSAHGTPWIQTDSYSTPIYRVPRTQPKVNVHLTSWRNGTPMQTWLNRGVPIPPGAKPAAGSDAHISIWQKSTGRLWSCWDTHHNGGWTAQTCQGTNHASTDPGYAQNASWRPWSDSTWTSTATGLAVTDGTITPGQLERGRIGHALALDLNNVCGSFHVWPAQQHDGGAPTGNCVPEGTKFFLPPKANCGALHPRVATTLCQAMKSKGAIVRDSNVSGPGLFCEDTTAEGRGDPYYHGEQLFGGEYPNQFLAPSRFPWDKMKVLAPHA